MPLTLQEINDKIKYYQDLKEQIEVKLKVLIENAEFKSMQNGTDNVEVQDILNVIKSLTMFKTDCDNEIVKLEQMKLSFCEKVAKRSKLRSDFYGY